MFGPNKRAAQIEASKAFAKELMKKYGIPTAAYETFDNYEDALAYVEKGKLPRRAQGGRPWRWARGVLICETLEEAKEGLRRIMLDKAFGAAGNKVVVEEYLTGKEFTPGRGGCPSSPLPTARPSSP